FDNAFVVRGAVGGVSKTAWVMDYPILERMYYDLAAGFNVFGNVIHQVSARRYMNLLRIESEAQFLRFLPRAARARIRSSWYRGKGVSALVDALQPSYAAPESLIEYRDPGDAKAELIERILHERLGPAVVGAREPIQWRDAPLSEQPIEAQFESLARSIAGRPGGFVQVFPDAALLRVQTGNDPDQDLVYSVIRNRSHANIDFMFLENDYLMPEEDTLHVVPGVALARPNLFLSVSSGELPRFFEEWRALSPHDASFRKFLDRYGVRRNDPRFWATSDFFNARFRSLDPVGGALLDLLRYGND
ncbi:MAG TPA: fatty acid cis/trans isomerase, partial [Polyangiaceae bacterium]